MVSHIGAEAFAACLPSEVLTFTQKHHTLQQVIPAGLQSHLGVSALSWGFVFFFLWLVFWGVVLAVWRVFLLLVGLGFWAGCWVFGEVFFLFVGGGLLFVCFTTKQDV